MYTEISKIIEGGLNKDIKKVSNYARLLAEKIRKDGDEKLAERILNAINSVKPKGTLALDELVNSVPVDQETRLSIVDVKIPEEIEVDVVLPASTSAIIETFINSLGHRDELHKYGIESTTSMLLYGPPGCGKTSTAQYIAKKTGLPLVTARLDSLISSLLGNTAKNIRKIFEFADQKPCILFLDEFDAIAKARDDNHEMGELKRVINSLLQNIDNFTKNNILIAATNHKDMLDKAIWRRFNTIIELNKPEDNDQIKNLIEIYLKGFENNFVNDTKKSEVLIEELKALSPSDIRTVCHNSIALAITNNRNALLHSDILYQLYKFNHHGAFSNEDVVSYLYDHHVSQQDISNLINISLRQVKNITSKA